MSERDKYRKKLESLLDQWRSEFDELEVNLKKAGVYSKADYDEQITALRQRRYRYKTKAKREELQKQKDSGGA